MYIAIALLVLANFVVLQAGYLDFRPQLFLPFLSECICATGVDPQKAYGLIYELKYPEDPCFKCFVRCSVIKIGFTTTTGEQILPPGFKEKVEVTDETRAACNNLTEGITDLCDKSFKYSRCIIQSLL